MFSKLVYPSTHCRPKDSELKKRKKLAYTATFKSDHLTSRAAFFRLLMTDIQGSCYFATAHNNCSVTLALPWPVLLLISGRSRSPGRGCVAANRAPRSIEWNCPSWDPGIHNQESLFIEHGVIEDRRKVDFRVIYIIKLAASNVMACSFQRDRRTPHSTSWREVKGNRSNATSLSITTCFLRHYSCPWDAEQKTLHWNYKQTCPCLWYWHHIQWYFILVSSMTQSEAFQLRSNMKTSLKHFGSWRDTRGEGCNEVCCEIGLKTSRDT